MTKQADNWVLLERMKNEINWQNQKKSKKVWVRVIDERRKPIDITVSQIISKKKSCSVVAWVEEVKRKPIRVSAKMG